MAKKALGSNGNRGVGQLRKYLKKEGWEFMVGEAGDLRGLTGGDGHQWHWAARQSECGRFLLFYGYCPHFVGAERRAAVAEYLTRANWRLYFGGFEMDWSDGQVCFRTTLTLGSTVVSEEALGHLVWGNHYLMKRYLPGLLAVALANADPEQAVAAAEEEPAKNSETENSADAQPIENGQANRFSVSNN